MELTSEQRAASKEFYTEALHLLMESKTPFLLGGAFAFFQYTGIYRDTKDLDVFCKSSEYTKILKFFGDKGYKTEIRDARWLAKVFHGEYFIDLIFDTVNSICRVDDSWYEHSVKGELFGVPVQYISPEELIWCKIYVQNRERFDGADINHVILKKGKDLNWERLYKRFDQHWHLLLSQLINFQFVYPSERNIIPRDLFSELVRRAEEQYDLPVPTEKVCMGPIIDQTQYMTDIKEWNYKVITMTTV
jgi:hypothetical protein